MNMAKMQWWKKAVFYHIYVRSFYDTNGDGVGDIPGIIQKLDYLRDLGVDAIWLSPIHRSPMYDFGYDVSSFRKIDPLFGRVKDFKELLKKAHKKKIRIVLDLVLNHTSSLHPWFLKSRIAWDSDKRDWYIWRKGKGSNPPNNWRSSFGGSAWEYDSKTDEYYLHSFLKDQPDLNWRNNKMRKTIYKRIAHWLDMGVDGFRLDVINWLIKDGDFKNNPGLSFLHHFNKKRNDRNQPEAYTIVEELRTLTDSYKDRFLVGEVFALPPGDPVLSASFMGQKNRLHTAFDFSLLYTAWRARKFFAVIDNWYQLCLENGWPSFVLSNHDQPRAASRWGNSKIGQERTFVAACLLLTLRGTPFVYYGEEIGMLDVRLSKDQIKDPLGKKYWPLYSGRDASRAPMLWSDEAFGGFSTQPPWLPLSMDSTKTNVALQRTQEDSLWSAYQRIIHLRRKYKSLEAGDLKWLCRGEKGILAYERSFGQQSVIIVLNFVNRKVRQNVVHVVCPSQWKILYSTHRIWDQVMPEMPIHWLPNEATIMICEWQTMNNGVPKNQRKKKRGENDS